MLIHLPIEVVFDPDSRGNSLTKVPLTLRFDTETTDVPVEITHHDPADPKAFWQNADAIVDMMPGRAWNRLIDRVTHSPADYCADPIEGDRRQQLVYAQLGVREAAS